MSCEKERISDWGRKSRLLRPYSKNPQVKTNLVTDPVLRLTLSVSDRAKTRGVIITTSPVKITHKLVRIFHTLFEA